MITQRTNRKKTVRWLSTLMLFGAALTLALPGGALAGGTDPNQLITNTATISYSVSGIAQDTVDSNATQFVVDRKVDLSMTPGTGAFNAVTPNSSVVWAVVLQNEGNGTQGYRFNFQTLVGNTLHPDNIYIYLDNGTIGTYESGTDTLYSTYHWDGSTYTETFAGVKNAGDLAKDITRPLLVVAHIPSSAANGQTAGFNINATTVNAGSAGDTGDDTAQSSGAWLPDTVQTVFADGHGAVDADLDGKFSVQVTYTVASATLAVTKSQTVLSDGIPGSSAPFKAVPGATVQYEITVVNNGSVTAGSVGVTDTIPGSTSYVDPSVTVDIGGSPVASPTVSYDSGTRVLAVTVGDVAAGVTAHVHFNVTID
jgi:uncharacterized repeat protein (TIGR01451 family)